MAHFNEIRTGRWKARLMDVRSKWMEQKINNWTAALPIFGCMWMNGTISATSSNTTATNMENSDCLHSTKQLNTKNTNIVYERLPDSIHPGCKSQQAGYKARYGHTHTQNRLMALCPGLPGWANTKRNIHALTPILIIKHLLSPTTTHSILLVQFTCLTVLFHNLSPGRLWSSSWSGALYFVLHTFLHPIFTFFSQNMPIP